MTTTLPDAAAQQQAAVQVFAQYEPGLYEAYLDMMVEWLAAVRAAMFVGGVAQLALMPDPMTVFSQTPKWIALASKYTAQVARDVLATPYDDLLGNGTLFDTRPFVRNWIAAADNRLQQVPEQVFGLVSHIIDAGTTNGASIPDVQQQIEHLFTDAGIQQWRNRARTVARTEVVGAYNGGLHDAFSMIVDSDPGTVYVHRWLATEDQRTRPDHREADGQVQPFAQPFIVGGYEMMHPHAVGAPAKEVVNCRCVELLEIENEPTKMSNRQYRQPSMAASLGELTFGFNPFQKRDEHGRWSRSLATAAQAVAKDAWKDATDGDQAFSPSSDLRESHRKALNSYSGSGYQRVNEGLRFQAHGESLRKTTSPEARGTISDLDSAMRKAGGSKAPAQLYRGTGSVSLGRMFGSDWDDEGDNAGLEWTQTSFTSTTSDRSIAESDFSGNGAALMRIHVPAGTRGVRLGGASRNAHEREVLLDRDLRFRIVKDYGVNGNGRRLLDVEVSDG